MLKSIKLGKIVINLDKMIYAEVEPSPIGGTLVIHFENGTKKAIPVGPNSEEALRLINMERD